MWFLRSFDEELLIFVSSNSKKNSTPARVAIDIVYEDSDIFSFYGSRVDRLHANQLSTPAAHLFGRSAAYTLTAPLI